MIIKNTQALMNALLIVTLIQGAYWLTPFSKANATTLPATFTIKNDFYISKMDCTNRLPLRVSYIVTKDTSSAKRHPTYIDDQGLLKSAPHCHPTTKKAPNTYQAVLKAAGVNKSYDVGHLAASNHLDTERGTIIANQWSNLAPQASKFNRSGGAWFETEVITECQREHETIVVHTGTIDVKSQVEKDYFVSTFSQTTPEYWWKILVFTSSNKISVWLMPNEDSSTGQQLIDGNFDVSLEQLLQLTPHNADVINSLSTKQLEKATAEFLKTTKTGGTLTCRGLSTSMG